MQLPAHAVKGPLERGDIDAEFAWKPEDRKVVDALPRGLHLAAGLTPGFADGHGRTTRPAGPVHGLGFSCLHCENGTAPGGPEPIIRQKTTIRSRRTWSNSG